jgi:hypothetical protein
MKVARCSATYRDFSVRPMQTLATNSAVAIQCSSAYTYASANVICTIIELMLALHLSLCHTRVACAHNRVLQSCYDAPMPVAAGAALNKRLSQVS